MPDSAASSRALAEVSAGGAKGSVQGEQVGHEERDLLPACARADLDEGRGRAEGGGVGQQEQVGEDDGGVRGAARGVGSELVARDVEEVRVLGGVGLNGELVGQLCEEVRWRLGA